MGVPRAIETFRRWALASAAGLAMALPGAARADNLADAMIGAYNSSGLLEQNRALLRTADEDVAIAISALRPVIDYILSMQRNYSKTTLHNNVISATNNAPVTATVQLTWLLYDGGQRNFGVEAARETGGSTELGDPVVALWRRFGVAEPDADFTRIHPFVAGKG